MYPSCPSCHLNTKCPKRSFLLLSPKQTLNLLLKATADVNEVVNPMTPWARTIDAINPHDPAINIIASGGYAAAPIDKPLQLLYMG